MSWPTLTPPAHPEGYVLFGVSRPDNVVDVTRIAVLMSHYYGAQPLAVHVARGGKATWEGRVDLEGERLFEQARNEARRLGYPLRSYSEFAPETAAGIREATRSLQPHLLVLGLSYGRGDAGFSRVSDSVGDGEDCPLVLVRFRDAEQFRHALVPVRDRSELDLLVPLLGVLEEIGCPTKVLRDTATVEAIIEAAGDDDLIVMHTADCGASPDEPSCKLADDLAQRTELSILLVRGDLRPSSEAA